jgi:hypothetical protein
MMLIDTKADFCFRHSICFNDRLQIIIRTIAA